MQAVLGLVEHDRLRPVDHLVGDLVAAMGRQAVHEHRTRIRSRHQPGVDLIALEQVVAALVVLIPHRDPRIRDHAVAAFHRLLRIGADMDRGG